jgi:hypothetical protein
MKADEGAYPLAYEPGLFGPDRWVLLTDGTLKKMSLSEIHEATGRSSDTPSSPAKSGEQGPRGR